MPRTEPPRQATPAQGEYLKRLWYLQAKSGVDSIATGQLANDLRVKDASVTNMLERLSQAGWVVYHPYHGARLTEEGSRIARNLINAHELLLAFLRETLGFSQAAAGNEAEHLEHHISSEFVDRLEVWLRCRGRSEPEHSSRHSRESAIS